ncbi:MAG: Hpt domain-containing protein [Magnetococcus sp. YQC-3]
MDQASDMAGTGQGDEDPYFQEYVRNFMHSAREIAQTLEEDILALEQEPGDMERIHRLFRGYHTLKGGARGAKWGGGWPILPMGWRRCSPSCERESCN